MFLYNLSLQTPTAITASILGHFSGEKYQEIIVARQQCLELWRPNTTTGKITVVHSEDMFCRIRSIAAFRLTGGNRDYVVLGSDTGAIAIIEYDTKKCRFSVVQYHEFGRTGLRRLIAGQYVATDPRGRAVMVAAVERAKLVYIVSRDSEANVAIASPLEANRPHTVCFDVVGVDVGYENPVFAALEVSHEDGVEGKKKKLLVYYEVDLGLNHVVRKWSTEVPWTANRLIALPGGTDGPSGVLVCSEGQVEFRHIAGEPKVVTIPRRAIDAGAAPFIIASAVHRMKNAFFILAQGDLGDLYKISVDVTGESVEHVAIGYFDTITPASSIAILRAGFLFAATSAGGNHQLFQFENLGTEDEEEDQSKQEFELHKELASLALVDEVESISPVVSAQVHNLAEEDAPQIYALCGSRAQSALKIVRHGLEVSELAVSELPGTPTGVWALRKRSEDAVDEYIVVSFLDATLVLSVAEEVTEVTDSGLVGDSPTLCVHAMAGNGIVQVTPRAVRHVLADGRVREWRPPQNREISHAAANTRQVVVALARTGGHAVYFEMDEQMGALREHEDRLVAGSDATCLALAPVAAGRLGAPFVAVGCEDCTVRVFSLDPQRRLEAIGVQATADVACSVAVADQTETPVLYAGLRNGMLVRAAVDAMSGGLGDTRMRVVGTQAVRLRAGAQLGGAPTVLALSSAPWVSHVHGGRVQTTPLSYDALDDATGFVSEQCPQGGIVAVTGDTLRILAIERPDATFNYATIPLTHTPRAFVLHPESRHFAVIETDHTPASPDGSWASLVRVLNPFDGESTDVISLPPGEAAISAAHVRFAVNDAQTFLAVGCVRNMTLRPRACLSASIRMYRWIEGATRLELEHETPVDEIPQALVQFGGMLLVALGRALRLYDMGAKRLLQKAQTLVAPHTICALRVHPSAAERVFVADVQESVQLVTFNHTSRTFHAIVDDTMPRYITCMHVLDDGDTVVAGDKFGNLFALRAPEHVARALDADPSGAQLLSRQKTTSSISSAANHWDTPIHFHAGDIVTSLTTCALAPGARPVILYSTLLGALCASIPLVSRSDVDLFRTLELSIRSRAPPISGRDHTTYRSAFVPVRSVIDGDLCERFYALDHDTRQAIADDVGRSQQDIFKKLDDMRSLFAF
ncbi:pre-mRNA-splicing factor rse1 [Coemansia sp. RSA 1813]|nr:pre-mRNA-splicing factor rse1 [Coemansia sp. RSA 1646]KAJ1768412.1 pre-mRNA-splicing factor rse1 [Coemansia sp. RSA 1843]KAJ2090126.1 pre-mRNA-splicing factor rse1 [Coemansia sp. RSA 986]KAJ2214203.1 pre-mRNA-splicing factor rse1 [Coemansia sp. RSA 487]KAJ2565644.1 pre-mRNA-splicing factor rse1 [Coemansia sp. RSA 1813]